MSFEQIFPSFMISFLYLFCLTLFAVDIHWLTLMHFFLFCWLLCMSMRNTLLVNVFILLCHRNHFSSSNQCFSFSPYVRVFLLPRDSFFTIFTICRDLLACVAIPFSIRILIVKSCVFLCVVLRFHVAWLECEAV